MKPKVVHCLSLLLGAFLSLSALAQIVQAPSSIPGSHLVSALEVARLITEVPTLKLVDCRLPEEFAKGHIEGAVNITDQALTAEKLAHLVPTKDDPVLFYCNGPSCLRSSRAVEKALGWGYRQVYWFRGGMQEWQERKLPLTR